ncbi:hypothetical protein JMK98_07755 [Pediococcus pentosaceus]|uniref:hypothetical protein n=1 Tax=Pediococcus pentosaceus TaxID=1255 RepID=UPI0019639693|nr:hypothetical protein [Pediococcus pentosaceus]MBM9930375.1 hypothetical protein [Pediococcus pentosaceus]
MAKLSHFTNKKKQVLIEDGHTLIEITVEEMLERYNDYIDNLVDNSSMNNKENLHMHILDSLFRAFCEYNIESGKSFLEFANPYIIIK